MTDDPIGLIGTTIAEKYLVERAVGEGGFAVVYRASHLLWKRPVAVKVFKALADLSPALREELTQDFIREGALLAELSEKSASICQARDVGVLAMPDGASVPYMVLEWLEGESLEAALEREQAASALPRTLAETVRLLDPIADALALAHARGIAHRDVKPANIFLLGPARAERCPVKLLDFGIAKVVQDIQREGGSFNQTGNKVRSFTPGYAAPEQFSRSHGATGPWTDVFALALVAVELLTGKAPLEGDDLLQIAFASGNKDVRPTPRSRGASTSDEVEAVFQRALTVEASERYRSADAFWNALRAAAHLGDTTGPVESLRQTAPRGLQGAPPSDALGVTALAPAGRSTPPPTAAATAPPFDALRAPSLPQGPRARGLGRGGLAAVAAVPVLGLVAFIALRSPSASAPHVAAIPSSSGAAFAAAPSSAGSASVSSGDRCPIGMAYVPGGSFFMGADDGTPPEKPAHKVSVQPYCIDVYEVTTAKYNACSEVGWCKRAATAGIDEGPRSPDQDAYDQLCNQRDPAGKAQHPINCVTWMMADVYCRSNKLRLPTEAEWEFAARGSNGQTYPWGDAPPSSKHLNACGTECAAWGAAAHVATLKPMYQEDDHWPNTAPVGSFPQGASRFGVLDLAGNVWEWVSDWYGAYGAGDGVKAEASPKGPATGDRKVIRGGAWNGAEPSWERPSFRYSKPPENRNYAIGFRCAVSLDAVGTDGGPAAAGSATP